MHTIKNLLQKPEDLYVACFTYRSTLLQHGPSPSQLLMGRHLRTTVPELPSKLEPEWPNLKHFREKKKLIKDHHFHHFNLEIQFGSLMLTRGNTTGTCCLNPTRNFFETDATWFTQRQSQPSEVDEKSPETSPDPGLASDVSVPPTKGVSPYELAEVYRTSSGCCVKPVIKINLWCIREL